MWKFDEELQNYVYYDLMSLGEYLTKVTGIPYTGSNADNLGYFYDEDGETKWVSMNNYIQGQIAYLLSILED